LKAKKIDDTKLYTCDLVCYGVPSPGIFAEWIKNLQDAKKSKLISMSFRDTSDIWGKGLEKYEFDNGDIFKTHIYTNWYFADLTTRFSCDDCKFCCGNRMIAFQNFIMKREYRLF
jgi:hypothetical protein